MRNPRKGLRPVSGFGSVHEVPMLPPGFTDKFESYSIKANGISLHAVIGGFHLNGPIFEPLIPRVIDDLLSLQPAVVVPAHCTGWRASHAIGARFGEAYVPNSVGTRFVI